MRKKLLWTNGRFEFQKKNYRVYKGTVDQNEKNNGVYYKMCRILWGKKMAIDAYAIHNDIGGEIGYGTCFS